MTNSSTITGPDPDLVISKDEEVTYFISKIQNKDTQEVILNILRETEQLLSHIAKQEIVP